MLTGQDIEVLDSVSTALSPLLEFINAFSAEGYVTISCFKPVLQMFNNDMLKVKECDTQLTKVIKTAILQYMNKSYKDSVTERLVNMALFLDPHFHTEYFSESESEAIKVQVMSELKHLVSHQGSADPGFSETPPTSAGDQTSQGAVKKSKKSLWSFSKGPVSGKTDVTAERLLSELSSYVNSPAADSECDPLSWWKVHIVNFPHISRLAPLHSCN